MCQFIRTHCAQNLRATHRQHNTAKSLERSKTASKQGLPPLAPGNIYIFDLKLRLSVWAMGDTVLSTWKLQQFSCKCSSVAHLKGWSGPYICTVYDRIFGDSPAIHTVYTPYIYGPGQPYTFANNTADSLWRYLSVVHCVCKLQLTHSDTTCLLCIAFASFSCMILACRCSSGRASQDAMAACKCKCKRAGSKNQMQAFREQESNASV